jgi:hypothetical protein
MRGGAALGKMQPKLTMASARHCSLPLGIVVVFAKWGLNQGGARVLTELRVTCSGPKGTRTGVDRATEVREGRFRLR